MQLHKIELAIRESFAPVEIQHLPEGTVRVWVSMNSTTSDIESACSSAGLAPHHVNLATSLWNDNSLERNFDHELGYVLVRAPQDL